MFHLLFRNLRLFGLLSLLSLFVAPAAYGDVMDSLKSCFNFLSAQDYARAETEAKTLLQRTDLSREEQRYTQLCLGRAYKSIGRAQDALTPFLQVEALSQTTEELATAYNWLGATYTGISDLDRAELYDQRARKAHHELGDRSNEAADLNNLARVVEKRGDVERALALYQESLALEPNEADKPAILNNIALIYADRKDYAQAIPLLRQALDIERRYGNAHGAAQSQINLGFYLRKQGKLDEAETELTAGLNATRLLGAKDWQASACEHLAELATDRKQLRSARSWYQQAEALYREIGDSASADNVAAASAGLGR